MQFVLALLGGGLLVLILTLIPMGLSALQKLWVAGMAAMLSMLLLLVKEIYPLPLAIILVVLCMFVAMYGFWKKANFLFVSVEDETSAAIDLEEEKMIEEKPTFQLESIKVAVENDDNSIKRDVEAESDERLKVSFDEDKLFDEVEIENDLFLQLEEIDEFDNKEPEIADSVSPQLVLDEVTETIEEVDRFIAETEEETQISSEEKELSELEEMEEIDFSARLETGYEEDEDEDVVDSFFDDFIREAELEEVESASTEETIQETDATVLEDGDLVEENDDHLKSMFEIEVDDDAKGLSFEGELEEETEKEQAADFDESEQPLVPVKLEGHEVGHINMKENRTDAEETADEKLSGETIEQDQEDNRVENVTKSVATKMLTLLHEQATSYKSNGLIREYEHLMEQILLSGLDDVMYFSIAAEYRDHLIKGMKWTRVQKLLDEMAFRCEYPLLKEEIRYLQSMVKNKMMK